MLMECRALMLVGKRSLTLTVLPCRHLQKPHNVAPCQAWFLCNNSYCWVQWRLIGFARSAFWNHAGAISAGMEIRLILLLKKLWMYRVEP